jgi:hypothetical protein
MGIDGTEKMKEEKGVMEISIKNKDTLTRQDQKSFREKMKGKQKLIFFRNSI